LKVGIPRTGSYSAGQTSGFVVGQTPVKSEKSVTDERAIDMMRAENITPSILIPNPRRIYIHALRLEYCER
jgi:hypothetical protein